MQVWNKCSCAYNQAIADINRPLSAHILQVAYLKKVVDHESGNASTTPLGVSEQERNVGFIVFDIGHHEGKANYKLSGK